MSYSFTQSETAKDRTLSLILGDKKLEQVRMELEKADDDAWTEFFFTVAGNALGLGG